MRPKEPYRITPEIEAQVKVMREQHPSWGKKRIADELAKGNDWVPLVRSEYGAAHPARRWALAKARGAGEKRGPRP